MDVFVARQPIFTPESVVFGYELLFRSSGESQAFPGIDSDQASASTISDSLVYLGLNTLTSGKRAFINFTRNLLVSGCATLLPKDEVVIELLETIEVDSEVLEACRELRQQGYCLALDDYSFQPDKAALLEQVDIIKVDFLHTTPSQRRKDFPKLRALGKQLLAEKVETRVEFEEALELGCSYIQGFYFCRPNTVSARGIPGFKASYIRLMQEIYKPDCDFERMEEIIKSDLSLTYSLLRVINSAAFAFARRIESVRQAIVLLGQANLRKWVSLLALSRMARDKPRELIVHCLVRACFCESLGEKAGLQQRREDLFLMGMFSLIDAVLDQDLKEALSELPLSEEIESALLGEPNELSQVLEMVLGYERSEWKRFAQRAQQCGLGESQAPALYRRAIEWVETIEFGDLLGGPQDVPLQAGAG